jgi:hypothetical protein
MFKHTPEMHPDYKGLRASLEKMKAIANDINEAIKQAENTKKIISIQSSFVNMGNHTVRTKKNFCKKKFFLQLVAPGRIFIRDGPLTKVCRKASKPRWFFLFTDIIVHASVIQGSNIM